MFIPFVPNTTIINKTIVYSDTVLNLKDLGSNIKVTTINNVDESSFEDCLKIIFKSNPNVVFNTIQYSKENEQVYFYTNKEITTKEYEESKFIKYKPITSITEILEETRRLFLLEKNKDSNCISIYDISILLKKLYTNYDMIYKRYKKQFNNILKDKIGNKSLIVIYDFDYKNKLLKIGFSRFGDGFDDIYFNKENGDLYITKSDCFYADEIFLHLGSLLSELYDDLLKYSDYRDDNKAKYCGRAVNSNFGLDISHYGVGIYVKNTENSLLKQFELFSPSYDNDYKLTCNSTKVNEVVKGNEDEIFRKIFVNICDCPVWCQKELSEIRKNQLEEEKRIEDELKYQEMKKQKRRELKRKIFPFLKK